MALTSAPINRDRDPDLNLDKKIPVMEIFGPTIQGEGALTGKVSYFVRTGGCTYRCIWCDQMEAVDPVLIKKHAVYKTQEEIVAEVRDLVNKVPQGPRNTWITLSGGDPLMWDLGYLAAGLSSDGMNIAVETQGEFSPAWLSYVDLITCSPKPPSSGMQGKLNLDTIYDYIHLYASRVVLKVVIFEVGDLDFAEDIHDAFPKQKFYLSVGTPGEGTGTGTGVDTDLKTEVISRYRWLADRVLERPRLWCATISPQMHTLLYGREKGR